MCICLHMFDICVYTHTPMVQQKSGTEAIAYSSYVALLFLLYNKNGYLEVSKLKKSCAIVPRYGLLNPLKHDPAGWSSPMCVQT